MPTEKLTMELSTIALPYGKIYHLFLSFCQEDEERVHSLLHELEDKYALKCLYHIRDFRPGVAVTENILENSLLCISEVQRKWNVQNGSSIRNHGITQTVWEKHDPNFTGADWNASGVADY